MSIVPNLDTAKAQGIETQSDLLALVNYALENRESKEKDAESPEMTWRLMQHSGKACTAHP